MSASRPGRLLDSIQRLKSATRDLQQHWDQTREHWDDEAAQRFQAKHLDPLLPTLRIIGAATSELDDIYQAAIRQCEDRDRV